MLADFDLLLTAVFVTADDLLPEKGRNAMRRLTDAEVVTLAVAQAMMNIASDREFLAVARRRLRHLLPQLPAQPGYWKRRDRLSDTIEWLIGCSRRTAPATVTRSCCWTQRRSNAAARSTPLAAASSRQHARITTVAAIPAGSGGCGCICWRPSTALHAPRSLPLPISKNATLRCACSRSGCTAEKRSCATRATQAPTSPASPPTARRSDHATQPQDRTRRGPHLAPIRQCIESISWTLKDRLGLERHQARTLNGLRARIATKLLALAASVWLNHSLGRPDRALAALAA